MCKTILFTVLFALFISLSSFYSGNAEVKWYTFEEAVELQKQNPKKIFIDVYTKWCGPCKKLSKYTFKDPVIVDLLNNYFYPVRFDAEGYDTVKFNNVTFVNDSSILTRSGSVHPFAYSITDGKLMYPTMIFLNQDIKRIGMVQSFLEPDDMEAYLKYYSEDKYKSLDFSKFYEAFEPTSSKK